jgi:hypothetical protein
VWWFVVLGFDISKQAAIITKELRRCKLSAKTKITRRHFLALVGGTVGATALVCGGLATPGTWQPTRVANPPEGDFRNWETIRAWAADLRPALLGASS